MIKWGNSLTKYLVHDFQQAIPVFEIIASLVNCPFWYEKKYRPQLLFKE